MKSHHMFRVFCILYFVICFLAISSIQASPEIYLSYFAKISQSACSKSNSKIADSLFSREELVGGLQRAFIDYAEARSSRMPEFMSTLNPRYKIKNQFVIQGNKYEVVSILGAGAEGVVYVVMLDSELFAVKDFYEYSSIKAPSQLQVFGREGRALLMQFVPGLPVSTLENHQYLTDLGLSWGRAEAVTEHLQKLQFRPAEENFVVDVTTGKIVKIDDQ